MTALRLSGVRSIAGVLALAAGVALAAGTDGPLRLPQDAPPSTLVTLATLDSLDGALAVTLSDDGSLAAAAFPYPTKAKSSLVRWISGSGVRETEVRGSIQALRFSPMGATLFGIAHREGKNGPLEAWLVAIDLESGESERSVTLPASARDLDLWIGGGALLVACRDELRTILLPQVRSGPLFWIPGDNRSVAALPGGEFVLLGQDGEILLVNLSDPQGRDPLPVRERVSVGANADQIAAAPDGSAALARLEDGTSYRVELEPLRAERLDGTSSFVAWLGPAAPAPRAVRPAAPEPEVAEPEVAEPEVAEVAEPPERAEAPAPEPLPPEAPVEPEAEPRPRAPAADSETGSLEGKITGEAASEVVAVVLLGPDNIVKQARRVVPGPDGAWEAHDLPPGSYRVVLDGGGNRVVISTPSFRQIRVEAGGVVRVEPIDAVRTIGE